MADDLPYRHPIADAKTLLVSVPWYERFAALLRIVFDRSTGATALGSEGTAAVRINSAPDHGTGGLEVWSGGATPSKVAEVTGAGHCDIDGTYRVAGTQVVGAQQGAIVEPAGGGTQDAQARAAIDSILAALRTHGLIDT